VDADEALLRVEELRIAFRRGDGRLAPVVDTANLTLGRHEAIGVVGESGSGKTMLCRALIGTLARRGAEVIGGRIQFEGRDLAGAPEATWRRVRGREIGYVPQSSLAGLNPVLSVGTQLVEALTAAQSLGREEARRRATELLEMVRIPRAALVLEQRSTQLSGGMRQRVMIAAALAQRPKLLIADEPTTALDVTVQHEILRLIAELRRELGMALILVSHDLAVIEEVCDSLAVMYAGATVESGPLGRVAAEPRHPYTRALRLSRVDTAPPGQDLEAIPGEPPTVGAWPSGCRFWPRCPLADADCRAGGQPGLRPLGRQLTACLHAERLEPVEAGA
jgi:oligopeptide/dipeptide ABC transporter ATP-binding protein